MIPARIEGCTRVLGAPKGWSQDDDGPCRGLPIRDELVNQDTLPVMISAWEPTPAEIEAISAGAKIMLRIVGQSHPPVMLFTGDRP